MKRQREAGVGVLIVVLFTAIVLIVIVGATATLTMGGRQGSANEAAAYQAVLAGESGQNAFLVRSRKILPYGGGIPDSCSSGNDQARALCAVNDWLSRVGGTSQSVGSFSVGNEGNTGSVTLQAVAVTTDSTTKQLLTVDIEAQGRASSSQARVLQRYTAVKGSLPFINVPGAVSSRPSVTMQGNSEIDGGLLTDPANDGIYNNLLTVTRTSTAPLSVGTPIMVNVPAASQTRASQLREGSYIRLPINATAKGTFKVVGNGGPTLTLQPVDLGGVALPVLPDNPLSMDYVMNGFVSRSGDALTVQATEAFVTGDTISVQLGTITYTAKVDSVAGIPAVGPNGKTLNVSGWVPSPPPQSPGIPEGSPIRKSTNAVVTANNFSECNNCTHSGDVVTGGAGSALLPDPMNDVLFKQTFGMSPGDLRNLATVVKDGGFSGQNSGLTWVLNSSGTSGGTINLDNEKVTGQGIIVIDGSLVLNQNSDAACAFSGVLYVRGNLSIQGNLQACGAIVVEGSILSSSDVVLGSNGDDSKFAGNGRKIAYSQDAIMDAVSGAGPYLFSLQAGTWRQR